MAERKEWFIFNGRNGQFWGPDSGGYWGLWGAGLYTKSEATSICSNKDRDDRMQHITEYRDQIANMRGAFERLSGALAESDELPKLHSEWRDNDPRQKGRLVTVVHVCDKVSYRNAVTGRLAVSSVSRFKRAFSPLSDDPAPAAVPPTEDQHG